MKRQFGRARDRRHFDFDGQLPGNLLQPAFRRVRRLGDKIKSAVAERIQGGIRALGSVAADHDDRDGMLLDDLAKHIEAVHPGHFQVERHHIGAKFLNFLEPQDPIHGGSHHLDGGIALQ